MKQRLFFALLLVAAFPALLGAQQLKVSILGDSYSTYGGYVTPATNACWYNGTDGGTDKQNDVNDVEQTWWRLFLAQTGYELDVNNSYSGSTVCHTGYRKEDYSDRSFITRIHAVGAPDILFVFGGTNDSWAKAPLGNYQYDSWTKRDLYAFRPAFAYLLHQLKQLYPDTKIYNITNCDLSSEVTESMDSICTHYAIPNIRLQQIDKQWGHPSTQGMKSICEQVLQAGFPLPQ